MSHSTQLSPETINQQAAKHDSTRESIDQQLTQLKTEIENTLAASPSAATRALSTTTDNWVESVRKSVLQHLETMAQNIRNEANNQGATDSEAMQKILNLPMETGNFLGVN
jgi:uncharacterized protein YukE